MKIQPGMESPFDGRFETERNYWHEKLAGEVVKGSFPYDYSSTDDGPRSEQIRSRIPVPLFQPLLQLAGGSEQRLFMILAAGVAGLLHRYTGNEDILLGAPVVKQEVKGDFLNSVLILRNHLTGKMSFKELLLQVRETVLSASQHQNYPLARILADLNLSETRWDFPLFDVAVLLENLQEKAYIEHLPLNLVWAFRKEADGVAVRVEFNTSLYKQETVERFLQHLYQFFHEVLANVNLALSDVEILTTEEKEQILGQFNPPPMDYPKDRVVYRLFEEQVERTPDQIAVYYQDERLTYRELNGKANQLAGVLQAKGVGPGIIVGIMLKRSPEMMIGILAILKAGGAYLPLNPADPGERLAYILRDSGAQLLLTQGSMTGSGVTGFAGEVLAPWEELADVQRGDRKDAGHITGYGEANRPAASGPHDLAYIIYTSGSTGQPKGVMIEHYSLVNRLWWMQRQYGLTEQDVILQKTPYTFDVSVWELFWWSFVGASVCFLENGGEKESEAIVKAIDRYGITTVHFVPSMLSVFLQYIGTNDQLPRLTSLRRVFASGEALTSKQVKSFRELLYRTNGTELHNLYGPTEATVDVTYYHCSMREIGEVVPIGRPIDNIRIYILDKWNRLQPVGLPGELCIGGDGLARGYLHRPELTNEKFVSDPFVPEQRIYRTGDLARWLLDGNIEFLGRMDFQVKIRGYRIELGEIETLLQAHPLIQEAVVNVWTDRHQDKNLCAYIVSSGEVPVAELKAHLRKSLPEYMVPVYFVRLNGLPLSANGKLDRKALPEPVGSGGTSTVYQAPRDGLEQRLAEIWSEILLVERIGIYDNFVDLGGHSLKVAELTARIYKEWGVEMPLREVLNLSTIDKLAGYLRTANRSDWVTIHAVEPAEYYPLSPAQQRLFVLDQLSGPSVAYNIPLVLEADGQMDEERLQAALQTLVHRHEALRTSFTLVNGEAVQKITDDLAIHLEKVQLDMPGEIGLEKILQDFHRPFDLSAAPLFRVLLVRLSFERHLLMFDIHHIISDGVSVSILIKELTRLYAEDSLPPLRLQYKDYAVWQKESATLEVVKKQERYWLNVLQGDLPTLELPYDYPRGSVQSFLGLGVEFDFDAELSARLRNLARETDATLFMVLLSIYVILLAKLSRQEDIIVGSPVAGRGHADLEHIVGMFVNTLPLRNAPVAGINYRAFLEEVKENAWGAFENQGYQLDEMVKALHLERKGNRNPFFDVSFILQNIDHLSEEIRLSGLRLTSVEFISPSAKFDLSLYAIEIGERIRFRLEYCTELFKEETVRGFAAYFEQISRIVLDNPEIILGDIKLLDQELKRGITEQLAKQSEDLKKSFDLDFDL